MTLANFSRGTPGRNGVRHFFRQRASLWAWMAAAAWLFVAVQIVAAGDSAEKPDTAAKANSDSAEKSDTPADAPAGNRQAAQACLIHVNLPLHGDADMQVRRAVTQWLGKLKPGGPRPVLVVELDPGKVAGGVGSDFSRAWSLATFLSRELVEQAPRVKTVAYIPKTIKGHAVLVAMACEEIVMAPDAEIGEAGIDETTIDPDVRSGYKQIADRRRTVPAALALAMLDRNLKALKVTTGVGTQYVLTDELEDLKKQALVQTVEPLKPQPLLVDGRTARHDLGFVSYLADNRADLAEALKLPVAALQDDPALAGGWRPVRIDIKRPITVTAVNRVQKLIDDQIRVNDVNLVFLCIDSDGGSFNDSLQLANFLAGLDPAKVRTVAYVPRLARADSALIALACDQLVMNPDAKLGGEGPDAPRREARKDAVIELREVMKKKSRSWSLPAAIIDPDLKVYRYTRPNANLTGYFCEDELHEQRDPAAWQQGELVTNSNGPLQLTAQAAEQFGLAWKVGENTDGFEQLKQSYGLERNPALIEPGWADFLIDALTSPGARMFLLIMIFVGVYLEVHSPGLGIGGFLALLAALLYFWAQHLQGNAVALEVLLFLAGILCVALEIFVLPGLAIFGLGGGLLIIGSLVLASQTFIIPANEFQTQQLMNSLLIIAGAAFGSIVVAAVMRRYLPHTPVLNRVLLAPPSGDEMMVISQRESLVELRHLLGQQGIATTPLFPSGKARFADQLVDVITDGDAIDRGRTVTVVDVSGSRVVVREVRDA